MRVRSTLSATFANDTRGPTTTLSWLRICTSDRPLTPASAQVYGRNMTGSTDRYATISDEFEARLLGIGTDQWETTVPTCSDWTVKDLVTHVLGSHQSILSRAGKSFTAKAGSELIPRFTQARETAIQALSDPGTADAFVESPLGEMTFSQLADALLSGDTLFHTWDLARATGQDENLDEAACREVLDALSPYDDAIRAPGFFADKITAPDDADAQTRLLCFGGRQR